ncbi:hypothetical protein BB558_002340 [Smittium angustum]|uniref:RING-type domain-containing protein n=1 Tax=Smittium angustum TaxID=133377 RepID=A0A2U1J9B1_SMIAN|nr:hypothetical protein BB558_002340 [Smittium angustum]
MYSLYFVFSTFSSLYAFFQTYFLVTSNLGISKCIDETIYKHRISVYKLPTDGVSFRDNNPAIWCTTSETVKVLTNNVPLAFKSVGYNVTRVEKEFPLNRILWCILIMDLGLCFFFWSFMKPLFSFFVIENIVLVFDILQIRIKSYSMQMGDKINEFNDNLADRLFWIQTCIDVVVLMFGLVYFTQIMIINGLNINIPGIFSFLNIQSQGLKLKFILERLSNYNKALVEMNSVVTMATKEEVENYEGMCPICWENLENSAKLPCQHLFHK